MNLSRVTRTVYRLTMHGLARGPHITRYTMYKKLSELPVRIPNGGKILSVSQSSNLCSVIGINPTELVEADYPEHNILCLNFASDYFDFVLSDQVLEHVEGNPEQAIDECFRVLRPGGIAVHTTCFVNPIQELQAIFGAFRRKASGSWRERPQR